MKRLQCKRCGHQWVPRIDHPVTCPKCRSPYWHQERSKARRESV